MNIMDKTQEIADIVIDALKQEKLTLQDGIALITRGEEKAASLNIPMVIAIVDEGGNLVAQHRMDDALLASISLSYSKAYTAVALRSATEDAAQSILPGQSLFGLQDTHPGRFCLFGGGIPIIRCGRCIGAIGVSGGTVEQDIAVAKYAAGIL